MTMTWPPEAKLPYFSQQRRTVLTRMLLGDVTSAKLADAGVFPNENRATRVNKANRVLAGMEPLGLVRRAGLTAGSWQHCSQVIWRITAAGRTALTARLAEDRAEIQRRQATTQQRREQKAQSQYALAQVDHEWLRSLRGPERRDAIAGLRNAGCTLEEIGAVVGLTRERVRQILAKDPQHQQ